MTIPELKRELTTARDYLNRVLDGVGQRWDQQVYEDGAAWTARQLLTHLAISDQGQTNTVMALATGQELIPPDFDLERYNKRSVEKRADLLPEQARQQMTETRARLNDWLETLDETALALKGRHGSLRILTIAEFLQTMADHERGHANDIARVLAIEP